MLAQSYTTGALCKHCVGLSHLQFYSSSVCRATLLGDSIPPRVANEIRLVTPANCVDPITADDHDIGLSLSFEGGFYHWRILLPFLPWADEVAAAAATPTKATIPLFELEDLMLAFVLWETAATSKRLVDSTFKVGYVKRVFAHLMSQHFATVTDPFSSASTFLEQVHSLARPLPEDSRAFLKVPRNAIQNLAGRNVQYTGVLKWRGYMKWPAFLDVNI